MSSWMLPLSRLAKRIAPSLTSKIFLWRFETMSGRFSRVLKGKGRVFGVKFRPGGFYPFLRTPVAATPE